MRKTVTKIISLLLTVLMLLSLCTLYVSAEEFNKTSIHTSYNPDNNITLTIDGNKLIFEGVVNYIEGLNEVCLSYWNEGEEILYVCPVKTYNNSYFIGEASLSKIEKIGNVAIEIRRDGEKEYVPYISLAARIEKKGSKYEFIEPERYSSNLEFDSQWRNIERYDALDEGLMLDYLLNLDMSAILDFDWVIGYVSMFIEVDQLENFVELYYDELFEGAQSDELIGTMNEWTEIITEARHSVKKLSDEIVGDETDEYEKVRLLEKWVADNLYYDMRFENDPDVIFRTIPDVIEKRNTVCLGYADLLACLIKEQGIPATCVTCSNPLDDPDAVNHIFVEAYVEGRWIVMDPTWDSFNTFDGKEKTRVEPTLAHFDMTEEVFSVLHAKSACMEGFAFSFDIPSAWAKEEIGEAFAMNIVPDELQRAYRSSITRGDFCVLLMDMIYEYVGSDGFVDFVTNYLGIKDFDLKAEPFEDDDTNAVLLLRELGIVNGVSDTEFNPNGTITREQAATMLKRAAEFLGISSGEGMTFDDAEKISDWAADGVDFVSGLVSADGTAVMGGTGEGKFSPKGSYTREQSIVSVYRLFRCR